jgi:hypothetical protein
MCIVDAFARLLLRFGTIGLLIGPVVLSVSLRWLLRIEKRAVLFWTVTAVMGLCLLLAGAGCLDPHLLVGPLAIPVVVAVTFSPLAVVPTIVVLALSARAQRGLEVLHVLCGYFCWVSLATLIVLASASV